jgi:hypothetical protein
MKLLKKFPDNVEKARKLLSRQTDHWKALTSFPRQPEDSFFHTVIYIYPFSSDVNTKWVFKVLLVKNIYTDEVYGLLKDLKYCIGSGQVWGVFKVDGTTKDLSTTKCCFKLYDTLEDAYEAWIGRLTLP